MQISKVSPPSFFSRFPSTQWALYSWPPVAWHLPLRRRLRFVHLATCITNSRGEYTPCSGQTIWGYLSSTGDVGLAWDWQEISCGVIAMVDPMRIFSNVNLVNFRGDMLTTLEAALHFNQLVRKLKWQEEVLRLLDT